MLCTSETGWLALRMGLLVLSKPVLVGVVSGAVTLASGADAAGADDIGFALMPPLGTMAGKGRMPEIGGKHSKVTTARRARHGPLLLGPTIRGSFSWHTAPKTRILQS